MGSQVKILFICIFCKYYHLVYGFHQVLLIAVVSCFLNFHKGHLCSLLIKVVLCTLTLTVARVAHSSFDDTLGFLEMF